MLPSADIPLELPEAPLAALFPFLLSRHIADGFKRSYINAGRQISGLVGTPVLALVANDDGIDFSCVLDHGTVQRVAAICGDLLLTFAGGALTVQALRSGDDEPDDVMEPTDLSGIAHAVPGCTVVSEPTTFPEGLHYVAAKEFSLFTGQPASIIGLGDFDADTNLRAFEILAKR